MIKRWYFKLSSLLRGNPKGLTLIELLIALSIGGLVIAAATVTINQLFLLGSRNENHMIAIRQVQNAGYWLSRDGVMAQVITLGASSGFPLTFSWAEWGDNQNFTVTYTLSGNILTRQQVIGGTPTTAEIARYITTAQAKFLDEAQKLLTVTITAQAGTISETRTYKVKPRSID